MADNEESKKSESKPAAAPAGKPAASAGKVKKKIWRDITSAKVYIQCTFNNTIVSITDDRGNLVVWPDCPDSFEDHVDLLLEFPDPVGCVSGRRARCRPRDPVPGEGDQYRVQSPVTRPRRERRSTRRFYVSIEHPVVSSEVLVVRQVPTTP